MTTLSISRRILFALVLCAMSGLMAKEAEKRSLLVLLGPPACGKGTLADKYVQKKGAVTLSTGNLCREHIKNETELGKFAKEIVAQGKLIPDNIIFGMVKSWLSEQKGDTAVILDGFPRTGAQADALVELLKEDTFKNFDLKVVRFTASENTVVERIGGRMMCENKSCQTVYGKKSPSKVVGICDKCSAKLMKRADDTEEVIKDRYKLYMSFENELLSCFEKTGVEVCAVSAEQEIKTTFADFEKVVG